MLLRNVWLRYGRRDRWVLREVALGLDAGQVATVLGGNGAGKSTFLQIVAGVLRPSRGAVLDRPRVVGWVPERFPADQPFTVRQYLNGMGRVAGLSGAASRQGTDRWIDRLGLAAHRDVPLPALSKGTAQKVGLAQALLVPPGLLVLDEPWEGLDAAARDLVPELVSEVLADGGSVLVSDHRGETLRLPTAVRWRVADGTVTTEDPLDGGGVTVVEMVVPTARTAGTVAALRAAGHDVLRVRQESDL